MTLDKSQKIRKAVVELLRRFFGDETADMYENFFQDEDAETILQSAKELLTEVLGEQKAEEEIQHIVQAEA